MKTLAAALVLSSLLFGAPVMAGSGHDHGHSHSSTPVSQDKVGVKAAEIVAALVNRNKLDKNWGSIKASSIEKITVQGNPEWVVVFVDKTIADVEKQKLYVFLTLGGDYIAANYTGK